MQRQQPAAEEAAPLVYSKEPYLTPQVPRKIQEIRFGLQSPQEMIKCGVINVHERSLYKMPERVPAVNGVLDRRLGIPGKHAVCETCGQKLAECAGHFGYIKLELPVFHIGYFKNTLQTLQAICKTCARVMLQEKDLARFSRRFRSPRTERTVREAAFKKVLDLCKRCRHCPYCQAYNGTVKKATGSLKVLHDRFGKDNVAFEKFRALFDMAAVNNDIMEQHLTAARLVEDITPLRALDLFERIPDSDLDVLDIAGRPEDLILTHLPVPPVAIRPSVEMDGASNEDDITMKLMQVIEINNVLRAALERGLPINQLAENWDFLQVQCAMLINSDLPGVSNQMQAPGRPLRGFVQRLKGKQGRFRGNLSGKRVDFSGRTVISPDPNLQIHQVCVPQHMAVKLTFPERVTEQNLHKLRQRVLNGSGTWPGANFVIKGDVQVMLRDERIRRRNAAELKVGDIVERHLEAGDVVLFNRQPSLHRISIMAFRAVVRPGRTLRFNECVCSPFNADFDGDEMNLHLPQTQEARAEAITLMGSVHNLCTPKNGEVLIAATQDFLTASFLLTHKDTWLDRSQVTQFAAFLSDACEQVDLPAPALIKPVELWSGKQLFSLLVRPNANTRLFPNLELPEREYTRPKDGRPPPESMCPKDGYVVFRNGELVAGRLGKGVLGGNKAGLFATLNNDYSPHAAAACMTRLAKVSARTMGELGFSIGIDDVTPADKLVVKKQAVIKAGEDKVFDLIKQRNKGTLELQPGCDADQSLEALISGTLNKIREDVGKTCMETLPLHNSPLIMSQCGSKGSAINIAQMVACVGQQSVGGKRCFNGFKERTLPHFRRGDRDADSKGFVGRSFFEGLTPTQFFFHTMAGREGLVDTAVKTAETGYMSRRLMKALEDLYCHYDSTVRNAAGGIVQFRYGDDGLDPVVMEGGKGEPFELQREMDKVRNALAWERDKATGQPPLALLPGELRQRIQQAVARPALQPAPKPPPQDARLGTWDKEQHVRFWDPPNDVKLKGKMDAFGNLRHAWSPEEAARNLVAEEEAEVTATTSARFRAAVREYLEKQADVYAAARKQLGLPPDARPPPGDEEAAVREALASQRGLTAAQLDGFLSRCLAKYEAKQVDPGSTVGAIGAHSIGEPGTQMTLKTFHFAGVASMNVTLGVPRIKEIINGAKNISTPITTVQLQVADSETAARMVKARLERTTLGEVAEAITQVLDPGHSGGAYIEVVLDLVAIEKLQLEGVEAAQVRHVLLTGNPKLKLKEAHQVRVQDAATLRIFPGPPEKDERKREETLFALERLMVQLPKVIVAGIPSVERAVLSAEADKKAGGGRKKHVLLVEGTNLQRVLGTTGVKYEETESNHIAETFTVLGIEAARTKIMKEIKYTMGQHGMAIDDRHTALLADCMTYKGEVLGITRFGIAKMKDSVLHTASFEKTADHLFDAAIHGRVDVVTGVSESIIMGIPMPTGTGLFKLVQDLGGAGGRPAIAGSGSSRRGAGAELPLQQRPAPALLSYALGTMA